MLCSFGINIIYIFSFYTPKRKTKIREQEMQEILLIFLSDDDESEEEFIEHSYARSSEEGSLDHLPDLSNEENNKTEPVESRVESASDEVLVDGEFKMSSFEVTASEDVQNRHKVLQKSELKQLAQSLYDTSSQKTTTWTVKLFKGMSKSPYIVALTLFFCDYIKNYQT